MGDGRRAVFCGIAGAAQHVDLAGTRNIHRQCLDFVDIAYMPAYQVHFDILRNAADGVGSALCQRDQAGRRGIAAVYVYAAQSAEYAHACAVNALGYGVFHAAVAQGYGLRGLILKEKFSEIAAGFERFGQRIGGMKFGNHVFPPF